jgi:hypothetical protein
VLPFHDSQRLWIIDIENPHTGDISGPDCEIAPEIAAEPPSDCRRISRGVIKAAARSGLLGGINARKDPKSVSRKRKCGI